LPRDAILFTAGDNDTFPLWYVQAVEGVRRDVDIVNMSLANVSWYTDRLMRFNPAFPLGMTHTELERRLREPWPDTVRVGSVTLRPRPSGAQPIRWDVVLLDIVETNRWKRPIAFAITTGSGVGWLEPFARLEGLHRRIDPAGGAHTDPDSLRVNLLERFDYRGFADSATVIEEQTRMIAFQYVTALAELLDAELARGGTTACRDTFARFNARLPVERLALADVVGNLRGKCG
jgi:hypothetical protein